MGQLRERVTDDTALQRGETDVPCTRQGLEGTLETPTKTDDEPHQRGTGDVGRVPVRVGHRGSRRDVGDLE